MTDTDRMAALQDQLDRTTLLAETADERVAALERDVQQQIDTLSQKIVELMERQGIDRAESHMLADRVVKLEQRIPPAPAPDDEAATISLRAIRGNAINCQSLLTLATGLTPETRQEFYDRLRTIEELANALITDPPGTRRVEDVQRLVNAARKALQMRTEFDPRWTDLASALQPFAITAQEDQP